MDGKIEGGDLLARGVLQTTISDFPAIHPSGTEGSVTMRSTFQTVVGILVALSLLTGCQSMTGKSAGQNIDDAGITASVKSKLVAEKASNLTRVDVDTTNGTVYLNGTVEDPTTKARAEQLAWQAKGVKAVVNNLQVTGK